MLEHDDICTARPSRGCRGRPVKGRTEGDLSALRLPRGHPPGPASAQERLTSNSAARCARATVLSSAGPNPAITALTASIKPRTVSAFESSPRRSMASCTADNLVMADERSISSCADGTAPSPPTRAIPARCSTSPVSPASPIRSRVPTSMRNAVSIPRRVRSFGQLRPVSRLRIVLTSRTPAAEATSACVRPRTSRRCRAYSAARRRPRPAPRFFPGTIPGTIPGISPVRHH